MASRDGQETAQTTQLSSRSVSLPPTTLRDVLRTSRPIHAVWTAPGEPAVVASGVAATVSTDGDVADRFERVRTRSDAVFRTLDDDTVPSAARPRFFGGFAFHDRHERDRPWEDFPGAWFVLPEVQVVLEEDRGWLTLTADASSRTDAELVETARAIRDDLVEGADTLDGDEADAGIADDVAMDGPPGVETTTRETTYDQWADQLSGALARIDTGDLQKVTLAQTLRADLGGTFPLAGTLERLGRTYPDCYRFAIRPGASGTAPTPAGAEPPAIPTFFGASPERLVERAGDALHTGALASTVARGDTDAEDERLATLLRSDEKFEREHEVVVDSIRDQLAPVAQSVSTGERTVRRLASIQHLYTPIEATASVDHVLEVVRALHPTPAVGGLPPDVALDTIRRTETFDRGWYAAPVGWFDGAGNGNFAVGIRSAVAAADTATLFAGNGIVASADPKTEWEEVQLKYRPILDALR